MTDHVCECPQPYPSGRFYMRLQACTACGKLMTGQGKRKRPTKLSGPPTTPQQVDRGEVVTCGARIFRANPQMTNSQVYNRLSDDGVALPEITTWLANGWASEARKLSGTNPIAGRPAK